MHKAPPDEIRTYLEALDAHLSHPVTLVARLFGDDTAEAIEPSL